MENIELTFEEISYTFPLIFVEGTDDKPFLFGTENEAQEITIRSFFLSQFTVTQTLYAHIMGHNPSNNKGNNLPVECVSFNELTMDTGFLARINSDDVKKKISAQTGHISSIGFRLPSETEWEYAAKGGMYRADNFIYSGGNDIDEVAWYQENSFNTSKPVGQKKPNQLGIHDMSGNSWEWCRDYFHRDTNKIPKDGNPCLEESPDRVLRGGCFHNWAIHCTSAKRYEIAPEFKDPCISLRLALSF